MKGFSIESFEILLVVSALVALIARRAKVPYTVGLVFAGVALELTQWLDGATLTKDLVFRILLPPLIFEAAFFLRWPELRRNLAPVLMLATFGVGISTLLIATVMSQFFAWPFAAACVFGSLIAATDPVAVIAMFKEMKIGGKLRLLVEAESLLNDGAAAVMFSIAVAFAGSTQVDAGTLAFLPFREVGGGILCGAVVAGACLFLAGKTDDHLVEITFTTIAAFGAFLLAEKLHCSGVLAVLVAGLMIGNLGDVGSITDRGREEVGAFWEFAAFVANSIIFVLIGVRELSVGSVLLQEWPVVVTAIIASTLARAFSVYFLSFTYSRTVHKIQKSHQHVLFWGGLKGALSLALAIGLPETFPAREEIIAASFGVVAFSVVVQGLTMPMLLRRLKLEGTTASEEPVG